MPKEIRYTFKRISKYLQKYKKDYFILKKFEKIGE
jgi:hypothetical protein